MKLGAIVKEQRGRDVFATVLNQYRSKKCDVGRAHMALNALMWQTLDECSVHPYDIHTAKVIMMLSQTFYSCEDMEEKNKEKGEEKVWRAWKLEKVLEG